MAWNRGSEGTTPVKAKTKKPSSIRGIVAGALVCILAIGAYFAFFFGTEKPQEEASEKQPSKIKSVTPAPAPKAPEEPKPLPPPEKLDTPNGLAYWVRTNYRAGVAHIFTQRWDSIPKNASWLGRSGPKQKKLYKTFPENYIVALMRMPPGGMALDVDLGPNFDDEFKARIADSVGYEPDDTEEDKEIRRQMVEFKKEAAKLIGDGQTPTEIVRAARKDLMRVGQMRNNLIEQIAEMRRKGTPDSEIELATKAANKILEKHGGLKLNYLPSRAYESHHAFREESAKLAEKEGEQ